jgi:hypothetical protein
MCAQIARRDAMAAPRGTTSGAVTVEISLIRAVRTHALCVHTQDHLGGRHRRAGRRGTAAHRPRLAAHALHTHAYAGLIRPREKAPRNSDLRHECQREPAGQGVVIRKKARRTRRTSGGGSRPSGDFEPQARRTRRSAPFPMQPPRRLPYSMSAGCRSVPRNSGPVAPSGCDPKVCIPDGVLSAL